MDNSTETLEDFVKHRAALFIWKYFSPCLIIIGTVANILSIIVLLSKSIQTTTTMFYLTVLAFGDIMVLYTGLLRHWLRHAFEIDMREWSNFSCKLHVFLVYFSLDFSTWILVAVTVDRCLLVCFPFKSKTICTLKNSKIVVLIISLCLMALNCHLFGTVALDEELGCNGISSFILESWPWVDFCVYCIVPFTVMIVCNTLIVRQIVLSNRRVESHNETRLTVPTDAASMHAPSTSTSYRNRKVQPKTKRPRRTSSITVMLLSVNVFFIICTLPIAVYLIGYRFWVPGATLEQTAALDLFWAISNFLQYTNNTVHFFMYCLTCPRFRKELLRIFDFKNSKSEREMSTYRAENKTRMTKY